MTPSLVNFFLSLVAGAVIVLAIGIAVSVVGIKDKIERSS